MTHEDIIKFAQEAGFNPVTYSGGNAKLFCSFAELVATVERRKHQADIERWKTEAATAEKWRGLALSKEGDGRTVQRIQQEATALERKACLRIADDCAEADMHASMAANAIRARGQQ